MKNLKKPTNSQIVRAKFKKAWSWNCGANEVWIMDGELSQDCKYFPFMLSEPMGKLIAKGGNVKQAWKNAAGAI